MVKILDSLTVNIRELGKAVRKGALIVFPTDTVYGLGCDPFNENSIVRILECKRRGPAPMPLLSSSLNDVSRVATLSEKARRLANLFWPGALTLVLKSKIKFNMHLMNSKGEVGFRVPGNLFARNLASELGGIIVGTSANISGQPAASTLMEALKQIGSKVDFAIDGGKLPGTPSTVVRFDCNNVKFIREGAISIQKIIKALNTEN